MHIVHIIYAPHIVQWILFESVHNIYRRETNASSSVDESFVCTGVVAAVCAVNTFRFNGQRKLRRLRGRCRHVSPRKFRGNLRPDIDVLGTGDAIPSFLCYIIIINSNKFFFVSRGQERSTEQCRGSPGIRCQSPAKPSINRDQQPSKRNNFIF